MTNYIVKRCIFWNIFWKRNITVNGFWVDNRGNYQFCKIICFNQGHANFFSDFCLCGNLTIVTYKLIEMNFQLFCKNGHQLVISSFLSFSFLFLFFAFLTPAEGCCKNQIHFLICLLFLQMKASYKCSLTCFTIQNVFIKLLTDFIATCKNLTKK